MGCIVGVLQDIGYNVADLAERFWKGRLKRVKAPYAKDLSMYVYYPEYYGIRVSSWESAWTVTQG